MVKDYTKLIILEYLQRYRDEILFKLEDYLTYKGLDNKLIEEIIRVIKNV